MSKSGKAKKSGRALGESPLDEPLPGNFSGKGKTARSAPSPGVLTERAAGAATSRKGKAADYDHYKVVSISLYNEDIEYLEALVAELRERGYKRVSKSRLIRFALHTVEIDDLPKEW